MSAMKTAMRLLLDDNVVIDYLVAREPFYLDARLIMLLGACKEVELWFGAHQINDIFYIISEGGKKSRGLLWQDRLKQLREFVHICGVQESDIDAALNMGWDDLEDACVNQCAEKMHADFIITRDTDGFSNSHIPALCPSDFIEWLREHKGLAYEEVYLSRE